MSVRISGTLGHALDLRHGAQPESLRLTLPIADAVRFRFDSNRGDSNAGSSSGGSSVYSHSSESSLPVTPSESSSPATPPLATSGGETVCDFVFDEGGDEDYSEYRNLIAKYGANRIEAALKRSPETPPLSAADSASATATSFDITSIVPHRAASSSRELSHDEGSALISSSSSSSRSSQRSASRDGLGYTRSRGHRLSVSWSSNVTVHDAPSISDLTHERAESGYQSAAVSPKLGPTACDVPAELPHMCQCESHAHSRRRRYPTSPRSARSVFDQPPPVQLEDAPPFNRS